MPKHRSILIVIADGEHARLVRIGPKNVPYNDTAFHSFSAHKRSADLGSDRPGAGFHTDASAHHSIAPRHDPHALEEEKFPRVIAHQLNEATASGKFDELVIVAPAHTLNAIQEELDTRTRALVVGTLAKDLVKTPNHDLWSHIRECVPQTPRVVG
jgi:protein required for attachment to host cells